MVVAAVLAGGSGTRMKSALPKQFLEICGVPVIIESIKKFTLNSSVDKCIVSVGGEYVEYTKELIKKHIRTDKEIFVITGGKTRGDTLFSVLEFMNKNDMLCDSIVLTHDAVRPFINDRIIDENIAAAKKYGACNTCVPAVDTVLLSDDGKFISSVPDRNRVFHAQTPQSFDAKKLYELILKTPSDVFNSLTDGCSVFTYHSQEVFLVRGENSNIKITFPEDIEKAELIIKELNN